MSHVDQPVAPLEPFKTDWEHLQLLAVFHYIVGGVIMLFSCFFLLYLVFGLVMLLAPQSFHGPKGNPSPPPPILGVIFTFVGASGLLAGWTLGVLTIYSGNCLRKRRRRMFSQVVAG